MFDSAYIWSTESKIHIWFRYLTTVSCIEKAHQECAENMSFRVDKAWRQRCSQRFRNILDMVAKKASVLWVAVNFFCTRSLLEDLFAFKSIQVPRCLEWSFFLPQVFTAICVFVTVCVYDMDCIDYILFINRYLKDINSIFSHFGDIFGHSDRLDVVQSWFLNRSDTPAAGSRTSKLQWKTWIDS